MSLGRLSIGEGIAGISAILLYVFMSFDWFGVTVANRSNLLFLLEGPVRGESAWGALDYISIVLLIAILAALALAVLRLMDAVPDFPSSANAVVAGLGIVSVLLILFRRAIVKCCG